MEIFITRTLFNEMADANSCSTLTENKAIKVFMIEGNKYVITSTMYQGKAISCGAYECVDFKNWKKETLNYGESKVRGYYRQRFTCKGKEYVFTDSKSITLKPTEVGEQINLF
jgi:hypothetical protein